MLYKGVLAGIVVLSVTLFFAYLYLLNRTTLAVHLKRKGYYRCPHYQHTDIFFGSDYQNDLVAAIVRGERRAWCSEQHTKYGKTFETNLWGKRVFQTCDPLNTQALLTAAITDAGAGPSRAGLVSWLGPGAFTIDGEPWKRSRDILKPVFKKTAISDMSRMDRHLNRLMGELEQEGSKVDLQAHFLRMFLDFTIDLLVGQDVNTVNKDLSNLNAHSFNAACDESEMQVVRASIPWVVRWWKGWTKTENQPYATTQDFMAQYVDSAIKDVETSEGGPITRSPAFLDHLITEAGSDDKIYLRDQLLNVFMPARDSVAVMASQIMFRLARHPTVYSKVRKEVLEAGLDRDQMSYESIKNLTYTNAVVNETLRLGGPPNGQTIRDVLSDMVLPQGGGVNGDQPMMIPRGSMVYVQIQNIHRDETAWAPDPDAFRPERWIETAKVSQQRLGFAYLPFGGGRRICPAMALAMGELAYIVAYFAVRFREIQNRDPEHRLIEEGMIVMKIRNGVQVRLVK